MQQNADILSRDSGLTHAISNYINASYRGRLAFLNALKQMKFEDLNLDELARNEKIIETVQRWLKDLWNGMPIFSAHWKSPETFDAQQAFSLLKESKDELSHLSNSLSEILKNGQNFANLEEKKLAVASVIRSAYHRENYARGFIEYGNAFSQEHLIARYTSVQQLGMEEVQKASLLLRDFSRIGYSEEELNSRLYADCLILPAYFRVSVNDINYLLSVFNPNYTFELAEIPKNEADNWSDRKVNPIVAGYWRSFNIGPDEAEIWSAAGFSDASNAGLWKVCGFNPDTARSWVVQGVDAQMARIWKNFGHSPDTARPHLQAGISDPKAVGQPPKNNDKK